MSHVIFVTSCWGLRVFDLGSYRALSPAGIGPGLAPNLWTVLCWPGHAPAWEERVGVEGVQVTGSSSPARGRAEAAGEFRAPLPSQVGV